MFLTVLQFYNNLCALVGQIKDLILSTCTVQLQRLNRWFYCLRNLYCNFIVLFELILQITRFLSESAIAFKLSCIEPKTNIRFILVQEEKQVRVFRR